MKLRIQCSSTDRKEGMENPCFVVDTDSVGEAKRWRSVPASKGATTTVATVCKPEEYQIGVQGLGQPKQCSAPDKGGAGGWGLELVPHAKPQATLISALLLATVVTLATTGSLVYLLKAVHRGYAPAAVVPDAWPGDMVVTGEFTVTNEPYRPQFSDIRSTEFQTLASSIGHQLELLFGGSLMSELFKGAAVISLGQREKPSPRPWRRPTPKTVPLDDGGDLVVHCWLLLRAADPLTISKVGLAFLGGLGHRHNSLWLGPYTIHVQSISFQASPEEVTWSQWSGWSECSPRQDPVNELQYVRKRTRFCIRLATAAPAESRDPCLNLQSQVQDVEDTETKTCVPQLDHVQNETTPHPTTSTSPAPVQYQQVEVAPSTYPPLDGASSFPLTATTPPPMTPLQDNTTQQGDWERRPCSECFTGEVCVALEGESTPPTCRTPIDTTDPTGCGGHCKINTELCHRMGNNAYRCVDNSKCPSNEWQCGNKLCIPLIRRCDGHFNCYDQTDEYDCECDLELNFQCGNNLSCLPKHMECNGIVDCWDGSDEVNCTIAACLGSSQFTCNDSQCIPIEHFCDVYPDCNDKSDEPFGCRGPCKNHEWQCSNGRCITRQYVCNNVDDCGDGSDEVSCERKNVL